MFNVTTLHCSNHWRRGWAGGEFQPVGKFDSKKKQIWGSKSTVLEEFVVQFKFFQHSQSFLSEIRSCLLDNCNFLHPDPSSF